MATGHAASGRWLPDIGLRARGVRAPARTHPNGAHDMLFINEDQVERLLSMDDALRAVEQAFATLGSGKAVNIPRSRVRLPGHTLHVMSGGIPALNLTGLKAYTTTGHGAKFIVLLFQADTGEPLAAIEADRLGQMRTGAASGVATKYMAREDACSVGLSVRDGRPEASSRRSAVYAR
ncbi:MAG: hypothetical protein F4Z29_02520 [Gemmatimonadetes bacterium]|nr:hypothetical protein [Gemmatimonadota bacterium]